MVGTLAVVAGFRTSANLTNAYGFAGARADHFCHLPSSAELTLIERAIAVSAVMLCTTLLLTLSIVFVKGLPWPVAIAFFLFYGFIDGEIRPALFATSPKVASTDHLALPRRRLFWCQPPEGPARRMVSTRRRMPSVRRAPRLRNPAVRHN
jgi:hypothetical protein